jgi:hypothetical protein
MAKSLGQGLAEFKRTTDEFQSAMLADVGRHLTPPFLSRAPRIERAAEGVKMCLRRCSRGHQCNDLTTAVRQ